MSFTAVQTPTEGSTVKPLTCGHKHQKQDLAIKCGAQMFGAGRYTIREKKAYVQLSRAARLQNALSMFNTLDDLVSSMDEHITALQLREDGTAETELEAPDLSSLQVTLDEASSAKTEIEALHEEMETWQSNLDGANMSHLPKYEEVSETVDQLQEVIDLFDDVEGFSEEAPTDVYDLEAWEAFKEALDTLNTALEEVQGADVSFPGMY